MNFDCVPEFEKGYKALAKKWPSLEKDLETVRQVIEALYVDQDGIDRASLRKNFFNGKRATILKQTELYEVIKMRIDCASLGNKDVVRLICIFVISKELLTFVELYSKTDKMREDSARIKKYFRVNDLCTYGSM